MATTSSQSSVPTEKAETFHALVHRLRQQLVTHWWIVFLTVSLGLLLQVLLIMKSQNYVFSEGKIIESAPVSLDPGPDHPGILDQDPVATQIALMGSPEVRRRADEKLRVTQPNLTQDPTAELDVEQQSKSTIFVLTIKSKNGPYAKALLDAIMSEYLQFRKSQKDNPAEAMLTSYSHDLSVAKDKIKEQSNVILLWKQKYNDTALIEQDNGASRYLADLKATLAKNQTEYQLLEKLSLDQSLERKKDVVPSDLTGAKGGDTTQLGGVAQDYLDAKKQVQVLLAQREELSTVLRPKHPKIVALNEEIARQNKLIQIYGVQSKDQIRSQKESLSLQISNNQSEIKEWEVKALDISGKLAEYKQLQNGLDEATQEAKAISDRISKISSETKATPDSMQIMAQASDPQPYKRGLVKALIIGALGGLVVGLGILLLINQLDDRVRSFSEMQATFDYPIIGHVPRSDITVHPLLVEDDKRHMLFESFRNIRSSIFFMPHSGDKPKTLLITSSIPNEGKSTLSSNLAITMAMSGAKTLLIDADMRRGALHSLFETPSQPGLADFLTENAPLKDVVVETKVKNLSILCRGKGTSAANDLLLGKQTDTLIKQLYPQFDYIILDSAPVLAADDTSNLAPKVDGVIFVLRASFTPARLARRTLQILLGRQVNIIGLIFNCAESGSADYPYYRYEEYHSQSA